MVPFTRRWGGVEGLGVSAATAKYSATKLTIPCALLYQGCQNNLVH